MGRWVHTDVPAELAIRRQRGLEWLVGTTHFIPATLAFVTDITDSTGFKGDPIPRFQMGHFCANFVRSVRRHSVKWRPKRSTLRDYSRGLMAENLGIGRSIWTTSPSWSKIRYHRLLNNKRADSPMFIKMHLRCSAVRSRSGNVARHD